MIINPTKNEFLQSYTQRLEELTYILQRPLTLLKECSSTDGIINEREELTTEQLTSAIASAAHRTQLVQEYRGTVANAVYGLDQSLRDLLHSIRPPQSITTTLLPSIPKTNTVKQNKKRTALQRQQQKQHKKQQRNKRRRTTRRGIISDQDSSSAESLEAEPTEPTAPMVASPQKKHSVGSEDLPEIACVCRKPPYGEMLGCDNPDCSIEWFHLGCVGLEKPPVTSTWLCPNCSTTSR